MMQNIFAQRMGIPGQGGQPMPPQQPYGLPRPPMPAPPGMMMNRFATPMMGGMQQVPQVQPMMPQNNLRMMAGLR